MLVFALLVFTVFAGNGNDVIGQLLLVPYPQKVEANIGSADSIHITPEITLNIPDVCKTNERCKTFVDNIFNHSVTFPLSRIQNLEDFRLSLHAAIDIPHITPIDPTDITTIDLQFTSETAEEIRPVLKIGVDESYTLSVTKETISISVKTVFGLRHAFETFIQLVRMSDKKTYISQLPITISDFPRFKWRGLLVDPSRNQILPKTFYKIVDSLAAFKINILHLHISDAQTFLFESKKNPEFTKKASYSKKYILTQSFLKELIDYAELRGIIVYPELDMPAHAASWGKAYPGVGVDCWDYASKPTMHYGENLITMNPADENTFPLIESLIAELSDVFTSDYIHVGGDEVNQNCWKKCKELSVINEWMTNHSVKDFTGLESYFNKYSQDCVIANKKTPIVWEEVFKNNNADTTTIVQVWQNDPLLKQAVDAGYNTIYSSGFYQSSGDPDCKVYNESTCYDLYHMWVWTFKDFYANDPTKEFTEDELSKVYGMEGCSWGESCDDQNWFDRSQTRFMALAERFWSSKEMTDADSLEVRMNYVRCMNLRRGISKGMGPIYCNYCQLPEEVESQ
ncbi:beta-hexosaminidase alpha chain precursor, putative [Entamoeba invadens IP1]|uniref:Beta-hexosaminidase n=1 Tax=Entamoeba invadens IP1 TaxID=370355 RepID=A0A0A1U396_ENTIV|nr:beta-hexosaminidase alpha chain precursor, putative [Entamoeba invadens IP1]ELP86081.1 beta-hexosaminidase alpha chain precursor, putative [Entamoeba invadens IP1]|eukprot:XP_004185427.1 beta-hexosaminidase alpha chain precursor, putative [Entamoeba invadens IP1]